MKRLLVSLCVLLLLAAGCTSADDSSGADGAEPTAAGVTNSDDNASANDVPANSASEDETAEETPGNSDAEADVLLGGTPVPATPTSENSDAEAPLPESKLTLGLPDIEGANDIVMAPLGTFVVARAGAGIRRAGTPAEPAQLEIPVYETPFGPPRTMLDVTEIDGVNRPVRLINWSDAEGVLVMRVIAGGPDDDWLIVQAPTRPHNSYVWVRRSDFDFGFTEMRIEIDLAGEGELTLFDGDDDVLRTAIVQGRDSRPTPTHLTYIETGVPGAALSPAYGTAVLSMASFSEVLGTFGGGGLPSNFLHGTNQPELMGQRVSSGEIRVPNEALDEIIETITPGTPVLLFDSSVATQNKEAVLEHTVDPAATVNFAEGSGGVAGNPSLSVQQLWRRCDSAASAAMICRIAAAESTEGAYSYLVAKSDAGVYDDEVGNRVVTVYDVPGGGPRVLVHEPPGGADSDSRVPLRNPGTLNAPLVLWPLETSPDGQWVRVQAPIRPQRRSVWVRADDFELRSTDYRIETDLAGKGELIVFDGDTEVLRSPIVSGQESRPTPLGESYIDQVLDGDALSPAYGPLVLSFPLFSDVLVVFGGGRLPRQSIHGTNQPELMGQSVGSGHIRIPNETITTIAELPGGILGARVVTFDSTGTTRDGAIEQQVNQVWLPAHTTDADDTSLQLGRLDF